MPLVNRHAYHLEKIILFCNDIFNDQREIVSGHNLDTFNRLLFRYSTDTPAKRCQIQDNVLLFIEHDCGQYNSGYSS